MKIICLGNPNPRAYKNNPQPPEGLPLDVLKVFATQICGLDIAGLRKTGDVINNALGEPLYTMIEAHEAAVLREEIQKPVEIPWLGGKQRTKIKLSKDSTPSQSLSEVQRIWQISGTGKPAWIAGNDDDMVAFIKVAMEIDEVRDYEDDGT